MSADPLGSSIPAVSSHFLELPLLPHHSDQVGRREGQSYLVYGVTEDHLLGRCGLGYRQAHACVSGDGFKQLFFSDWEVIGQDGSESRKFFPMHLLYVRRHAGCWSTQALFTLMTTLQNRYWHPQCTRQEENERLAQGHAVGK